MPADARTHEGCAPGALHRHLAIEQRTQWLDKPARRRTAQCRAERLVAPQRCERLCGAAHRRQHLALLHRVGCACESPDCQPVDCAWATLAGCNLLQDALAVSGVARLRLLHVDGVGEVVNHDGIGHEGAVGARSADEHHHGLVPLERRTELDKALHGAWQASS